MVLAVLCAIGEVELLFLANSNSSCLSVAQIPYSSPSPDNG
jgi:hypothetical protein